LGISKRLFGEMSLPGLDIGAHSIKLVQLKRKGNEITVAKLGQMETPYNAFDGGKITNPEAVAQRIKLLIKKLRIKEKRVFLSLSDQNVITRSIVMPKMTAKELKEAMRWEAEKYITLPIQDAVVDYVKLQDIQSENKEEMKILLVASARNVVNSYIEVLESIKLFPVAIDIEAFSLLRVIRHIEGSSMSEGYDDKIFLLLDLGADSSNLIVIENGQFAFSRNIAIGGNNFTQSIMEREKVSREEAESLKGTPGFLGLGGVQELVDDLLREIRRSIDYYLLYKDNNSHKNIDELWVTGGGIRQNGLLSFLGHDLKLEPKIINLFHKIGLDKRYILSEMNEYVPFINIAGGAALRGWY